MDELRNVPEDSFPAEGEPEEKLRFLLRYVTLAPSRHNTQPWLFGIHDDTIGLYIDRTRSLPVVDPEGRELTMSCGAALFHLRTAIRRFGYVGSVETFPNPWNPDLLARVRLGDRKDASEEDKALFDAMRVRSTNRGAFEDREVPESLLWALKAAASEEGAWLHIVEGEGVKEAVADLIAEGARIQWADEQFRRELAAWSHSNRSRSYDGIPGYAMGLGDIMSAINPLMMRTFSRGDDRAVKDRQLAVRAPVLAVLGTAGNAALDWLAAGQALGRVLLRARTQNVWASFLSQPIEVPELWPRLIEALGRAGCPQIILRMGYGPEAKPTPRRPIEETIVGRQPEKRSP